MGTTCKSYLQVQDEGTRTVKRNNYNLNFLATVQNKLHYSVRTATKDNMGLRIMKVTSW